MAANKQNIIAKNAETIIVIRMLAKPFISVK